MSLLDLPYDVIMTSELTDIDVNNLIITCSHFYNSHFIKFILINKYKILRKDLSEDVMSQYHEHHQLVLSVKNVSNLDDYLAWSIIASNIINPSQELIICDSVIPGGVMRYWKVEELLFEAVKIASPYLVELIMKELIPRSSLEPCFYASILIPLTSAILNDKMGLAEIMFVYSAKWHDYWIKQILDKLPKDKVASFKSRLT